MIRKKSDFSIHKEQNINLCTENISRELVPSQAGMQLNIFPSLPVFFSFLCDFESCGGTRAPPPVIYWSTSPYTFIPLLNCQRSIFLTVSIIFPSSSVSYRLVCLCVISSPHHHTFPSSFLHFFLSPRQHHQLGLYRLLLADTVLKPYSKCQMQTI